MVIYLYRYTPVKFKTTFFPFDQTSIDLYGFIGTYKQSVPIYIAYIRIISIVRDFNSLRWIDGGAKLLTLNSINKSISKYFWNKRFEPAGGQQ